MKKNIALVILAVFSFLTIVYAYFQMTATNRAREQAEQNLVVAKTIQLEAQKQMELAREEAERANLEVQGALKLAEAVRIELEKCKGKK